MTLIIGIVVGFFIRHVLWYPEKRQKLMQLFKTNEHPTDKS